MKHQYFGDINDYRKYGLLRILSQALKLRVGVCWMLTDDDDSTDGECRQYLENPPQWRRYDPTLFDALHDLYISGAKRSVGHAATSDLVPDAVFFDALLTDDNVGRVHYFTEAWKQLAECPLLFFDPDNGIEVPSTRMGTRGSAKYLYWHEIKQSYKRGHSLLIYQHYPRIVREAFVPFLAGRLAETLNAPSVTAFPTSYVVFFLVAQPAHALGIDQAHEKVVAQWPKQIKSWK